MMNEKECGIITNATFPSVYELISQPGAAIESVDLLEETNFLVL